MAVYGKIIVQGLFSENSDYSNPTSMTSSSPQTETPTAYYHQTVTVPTSTPALALDLSSGVLATASASSILIRNRDTTNYVTVIWRTELETITNPGGSGITFASSGNTITDAATASKFTNCEVGDIIFSANAEDSDNRITGVILTKASANEITISSSVTTDANDTTATFTRGKKCQQKLPAGAWMVIPGNLMYRSVSLSIELEHELSLQANTASCECEIFILGT